LIPQTTSKGKLALVNRVIAGLFPLLAVAINFLVLREAWKYFGVSSDLPEFYCAARLVASHCGSQVYDLLALGRAENLMFPSLAGRVIGLMVPPLAIPWLVPLSLVPIWLAPALWKTMSVLALLLATLLLKKVFVLTVKDWLWLITGLAFSGPLFESLRIDQLAPLLLFAFCLALWAIKEERPVLAALALSFFWLKPQQIFPLIVLLLACRRFAILKACLVFSLVLAVASVILMGVKGVANYAMIFTPLAARFMQAEIGPNFRGQLLRFFPDSGQIVMAISLVTLLSAAVLIFLATGRLRKASNWLELGTLLSMPVGLLTSLHCHDYDLILLTPSIVALFKYRQKFIRFRWLLIGCAFVAAPFVLPIYIEIHYAYLLKGALVNPYFVGLLIFAISVFVLVNANAEKLEI
jgi:Glycosyltransferase family 87